MNFTVEQLAKYNQTHPMFRVGDNWYYWEDIDMDEVGESHLLDAVIVGGADDNGNEIQFELGSINEVGMP